ncbi:MAG: hypothetical protein ACRDQ4_07240 [Pseudonocardiaceae bacterium]
MGTRRRGHARGAERQCLAAPRATTTEGHHDGDGQRCGDTTAGGHSLRAAQGHGAGRGRSVVGHRVSEDWVDLIRIEGFGRDYSAWREWTSSLIVFSDELGQCQHRVQGSAVQVLNEVLTGEPSP